MGHQRDGWFITVEIHAGFASAATSKANATQNWNSLLPKVNAAETPSVIWKFHEACRKLFKLKDAA